MTLKEEYRALLKNNEDRVIAIHLDYKTKLSDNDKVFTREHETLMNKCIASNGDHEDDGGLFFFTCKHCGFCEP